MKREQAGGSVKILIDKIDLQLFLKELKLDQKIPKAEPKRLTKVFYESVMVEILNPKTTLCHFPFNNCCTDPKNFLN